MSKTRISTDANEAVAHIAYRTNEVVAIYPITPASPMGEHADEWSAKEIPNVWGTIPQVVELQSEGGAAGSLHGALQAGALSTTFTASQGLLLMLPNMYKIAGELTPAVIHVAARSLATHALSIFGDHSDVMACRGAGFAMLCSNDAQEAMDFALISQRATLQSRVPILHFFDGFRTSHEIMDIEYVPDDVIRSMIKEEWINEHRQRALSPDHPVLRGTAQNPDVFFQCREACNPYYLAFAAQMQSAMDHFATLTGRKYKLFDYVGDPEADRVVVLMGSGCGAAEEAIEALNSTGERVGILKVRLFRPFDVQALIEALPRSARSIAVLDRTKEPGAPGEPLYLDLSTALMESGRGGEVKVIGGRYGLSSKEFTPSMVVRVLDELKEETPRRHFTLGIVDDVSHLSLAHDPQRLSEKDNVFRGVFYGLGSDGTVGANKNSIKIIGDHTSNHVQAYFVYDSKKAGSVTVSHLRFGPEPIRSTYLIERANFVACHQFNFLEKFDVLAKAADGATFLLNSAYPANEVWDHLPIETQTTIREKKLKFHVIDAYGVAEKAGMGRRINTVMQVCFFALTDILDVEAASRAIKEAIEKTYGAKGGAIVQKNFEAVDHSLAHLEEVEVPTSDGGLPRPPIVPTIAPDFVQRVTAIMLAGNGDSLPVSAFPPDGTWPTGTAKWEKRNIAPSIPIWDPDVCIQCNKCALVCPHAAIRTKAYAASATEGAPEAFLSVPYRDKHLEGLGYTVQVAPEDCTGCGVCVDVCPAKNKRMPKFKAINMRPHAEHVDVERKNYDYFLEIQQAAMPGVGAESVKGSQFQEPLFEYSGACAGCGETPYVKLLSQLFGDRLLVANATGCSSIYGGNLPTTPWTTNAAGRGPAWANSLFEDNAEFGLGFRLAVDGLTDRVRSLLRSLAPQIGPELVEQVVTASQMSTDGIAQVRAGVDQIRQKLKSIEGPGKAELTEILDYAVEKTVWIVGGDGWAYDIGFGGLDHVLASGKNVNVLVLDTMVYSNTGGQASKATPLGAVAKFAAGGKSVPRKNLAMLAMTYQNVYVAQIAMGAKDTQTVQAFVEAERYPGPSLIVAYSQCIAHGLNMTVGMRHQKAAVDSGMWPLFRFDPTRHEEDSGSLRLDSKKPSLSFSSFAQMEGRFKMLEQLDPTRAAQLFGAAQKDINAQWDYLQNLSDGGKQ